MKRIIRNSSAPLVIGLAFSMMFIFVSVSDSLGFEKAAIQADILNDFTGGNSLRNAKRNAGERAEFFNSGVNERFNKGNLVTLEASNVAGVDAEFCVYGNGGFGYVEYSKAARRDAVNKTDVFVADRDLKNSFDLNTTTVTRFGNDGYIDFENRNFANENRNFANIGNDANASRFARDNFEPFDCFTGDLFINKDFVA